MTDASAERDILEAARHGKMSYALLIHAASQAARSVPGLLDDLSCHVAWQYAAQRMSFAQADAIMNALWSICASEEFLEDHDRTIPDLTYEVFLAFDAGEYYRQSDPPGTDPEVNYTQPLIAAFLARHEHRVLGTED